MTEIKKILKELDLEKHKPKEKENQEYKDIGRDMGNKARDFLIENVVVKVLEGKEDEIPSYKIKNLEYKPYSLFDKSDSLLKPKENVVGKKWTSYEIALEEARVRSKKSKGAKKKKTFISGVKFSELASIECKPPEFIIDPIIPEGLSLICGRPKKGKSWFCLNLAVSIITGKSFLDFETKKCDVVYFALENIISEIVERVDVYGLLGKKYDNEILFFTDLTRNPSSQIEIFEILVEQNPNIQLIIIDTLGRAKPVSKNGFDYDAETRYMGKVQKWAKSRKLAIVFVHHTRKSSGGDSFQNILGSTALEGCSDSNIILDPPYEGSDYFSLSCVGRRTPESNYAIKFDKGKFERIGDLKKIQTEEVEHKIMLSLTESPKFLTDLYDEIDYPNPLIRSCVKFLVKDRAILQPKKRSELQINPCD